MDFSQEPAIIMFENIIPLLILLVVDYLLGAIGKRLPEVRFQNWRGIFKRRTATQLPNLPKSHLHTARPRRKRRNGRQGGRKGLMTLPDLTKVILSYVQGDTPQEMGATISESHSGPSNIECQLVNKSPSQRECSAVSNADAADCRAGTLVLLESGPSIKLDCHTDEAKSQRDCTADDVGVTGEVPNCKDGFPHQPLNTKDNITSKEKERAKPLKKTKWMIQKKELKSPWAEFRKTTEYTPLVQRAKKVFRYPYQESAASLIKTPEDDITKEQINDESASQEPPLVLPEDPQIPENSGRDTTASKPAVEQESICEEEIPSDVLRISCVETIYDSINGRPTEGTKKVTSTKPYTLPRASLKTPSASCGRRKRRPMEEWQVPVTYKNTLGHKRKNLRI